MGFGVADVQRDRAGRDRRVTAPQRREPIDREPREERHRDQVREPEDLDVSVSGEQQRAANGNDIERYERAAVGEMHVVRNVVRMLRRLDRRSQHRREQNHRDSGTQRDERSHSPSPVCSGFERKHGEGHEHREHDEGDQEIDPERNSTDVVRHVALDSPPHERLVELMCAEEKRQGREQEVIVATAQVAVRIDTDRSDDGPADEISLRREAHGAPYCPSQMPYSLVPITRADSLLVGALLGQLWVRRKVPTRGLTFAAWPALAFYAFLVANRTSDEFLYRGGWTLVAIAVAIMILAILESNWIVNRVLAFGPLRLVGRVSYGLYIWHLAIFEAIVKYGSH